MNSRIELLDRVLAERSLAEFVRQAWEVLEPNTPYLENWHHGLLVEALEAVANGELRKLIVNLPPRYGKSLLVSVSFPCWMWLRAPAERFLFASYSKQLATKHSVDRRALIQSPWYAARWSGAVKLADDANQKAEFSNTQRGHMIATSVGASAIGFGGNFLVCDDLINPEQANSDLERAAALDWFDRTFSTRLDDKKIGRQIIVEQRTHANDLTGHLLAERDWYRIALPAIAERKTIIVFPCSRTERVREEGDILWPAREGPAELEAAKLRMGALGFSAQYQQAPTAPGGNLFKEEWLRQSYRTIPRAFDGGIVLSLDTAYKTSSTSDFSAGVVVGHLKHPDGEHAPGFYLLWAWQSRCEFPDLVKMTVSIAERWSVNTTLVEDAASGPSLVQSLQRETSLAVMPVKVDSDKVTRATAVTPLLESGRLFLPETGPWIETLKTQLTSFPQGAHDDLVDALSQALNYLREQKEDQAMGWLRLLEEQSRSSGRPGPAAGINAYEAAKVRAEIRARVCVVCHRPIGSGTHTKVGPDYYVHRECEGKPIAPVAPRTY
jgi:predicted phage terminase large subunit-like protein